MSEEDEAKVPDSDSPKDRPKIDLTGEAKKAAIVVERSVPADADEKPTTKDKGS